MYMKLKKSIGFFTAALCFISMLSSVPFGMPAYAEETAVKNDFEINYDGWYGNADSVKLTAEKGTGLENSRGMTVSGRRKFSDGASSSKGLYLSGGVRYTYSVWVCGDTDEVFNLSLVCEDKNGNESTVLLASEKARAGQWTNLSAEYKAPENSSGFRLSLFTDSVNDFRFDEVSITSKINSGSVCAASVQKGLKDEFANYFRVGNILNGGSVKNSAVTATIIKDFNSITCENETKPDATLVQSQCTNENIGVSLNNAAAIFDFCIRNNISVRGHVLVWHSQVPLWFFKDNFRDDGKWVSEQVMDKRMESYIKNLFKAIETQYPQLDLYAYDVVNEAVSDDYNRTANFGGAREPGFGDGKSPWVQIYGGNSFIEKAFKYARKYAPQGCKLYYNDYNEYWDHKRDCIYKMCKDLYDKGILDGVGMQTHVNADVNGFSGAAAHAEAMRKYLSIGCDVQITEMDVNCEKGKFTPQQQADKYKAIFKSAMDCNSNPDYKGRVTAVCLWGPNDANTWISAENAPLLYDTKNQPKAAYKALTSMIPRSKWGDGSKPTAGKKKASADSKTKRYSDGFEKSVCGWSGRGSAAVSVSSKRHYKGKKSLFVKNRTAAWNGAAKSLDAKEFVPGNEYLFSVNVMYTSGGKTDTFYMKLQYTDKNGTVQYASVAEGTAAKGKWIKLENKSYKIPADASDMQIYVETAGSTNNFYIDEAKSRTAF